MPAASAGKSTITPLRLSGLEGMELRQAGDGWHGLWRAGGVTHQVWLPQGAPGNAAPYTVRLPFDAFFELRAHAARRFWRALDGRAPGPDYRAMPDQLRHHLTFCLRVLDGRLSGMSYRGLAGVLLGFRGTKEDWETDSRKSRIRRMSARGLTLMRGSYRQLLHYPIRPPSRASRH